MGVTARQDDHGTRPATGDATGPAQGFPPLAADRSWPDEFVWRLAERVRTQRLQQQLRRARQNARG